MSATEDYLAGLEPSARLSLKQAALERSQPGGDTTDLLAGLFSSVHADLIALEAAEESYEDDLDGGD